MAKRLPIVLWLLALIAGGWLVYSRSLDDGRVAEIDPQFDGRAFRNVQWKHFRSIPAFELTERSGEPFNSATLAGRPYVVSFFFSTCPTICRDLNRQIARLADQFRKTDLTFLSITVYPENDSPEVLRQYADQFQADEKQWLFLTGKLYKIHQLGQQRFNVIVDKQNHTGDIMLVDRWGRFRDRFTWDDPREMKRFAEVAKRVLAEEQPPMDQSFETRCVMAGTPHDQLPKVDWLDEFHLTDQNNQPFFSRDLTGQVWVASFFFTTCPGICPRQNQFLKSIESRLNRRGGKLVSITTRPQTDTPAKMRQYARRLEAGDDWTFLTGQKNYIRRVGSEFLGIAAEGEHHSSLLVVVDRWGNVRGRINWQVEDAKQGLLELVGQLAQEQSPPAGFQLIEKTEGGGL